MCWVFDVSPSHLRKILWSNSLTDIEVRTKLKLGFEQAVLVQGYQSLISVVSAALGGKPTQAEVAVPVVPQTREELEASFKAVFGG